LPLKLGFKIKTVGSPPIPTKPWVATQTGLKGRLSPHPLRIPGSFTARFARWLCFSNHRDRLEILPLRGTFISGLQP